MNQTTSSPRPWLPYVAPMATFLLLTSAEGWLPKLGDGVNPTWYATFYAIKIALVAAVAWACRSTWRDLRPMPDPIGDRAGGRDRAGRGGCSGWGSIPIIRDSA